MSVWSKLYERINWKDLPQRLTALAARNLNKMDLAIDQLDDRTIDLNTRVDAKSTVAISDTLASGDTIANITINGTTTAIKAKQPDEQEMNARSAMLLLSPTPIAENAPFVKRISGGNVPFPALLKDKIIGASVVWNQLVQITSNTPTTTNDVIFTPNTDGSVTVSGTATATASYNVGTRIEGKLNHILYLRGCPSGGSGTTYRLKDGYANGVDVGNGLIYKCTYSSGYAIAQIVVNSGTAMSGQVFKPQITDLTAMFGSTIADYVYTLETQTAGSGIAWLKSYGFFANDYYAYSANTLQSVSVSAKKNVGKNLLKIKDDYSYNDHGITITKIVENGVVVGLDINGTANANFDCYPFVAPNLPQNTYYISTSLTQEYVGFQMVETPDYAGVKTSSVFTNKKVNGCYVGIKSGTVFNHLKIYPMVCYNSVADKTPKPYKETTVTLDHTTLRGLFKLDANNNLYADGDIYPSSGSGSVKYGVIDLSTQTWTHGAGSYWYTPTGVIPNATSGSEIMPIICDKYVADTQNNVSQSVNDKTIAQVTTGRIAICDSSVTSSSDITGILIYKLATPTTASLTPYSELQNIASGGTEEFIDYGVSQGTRDVSIPVGGDRKYYQGMELPTLPTAAGAHNLQYNPASGFSWS